MRGYRLWSLAGKTIAIDEEIPLDGWSDFAASPSAEEPICRIERGRAVKLYGVEGVCADHPVAHILRAGDACLAGDEAWERLTLWGEDGEMNRLLSAALCARLSVCHVILLHGGLVALPSVGGVLFIGDSGIGKSTQAALWARLGGGRVLNGDRVLVRAIASDGGAVGYGSPWGGAAECRVHASTTLSVILELTRGRVGSVRRLSPAEAVASLLRRTMVPGWDAAMATMAAAAAETVGWVAAAVPMVSLCVPTGDPAAGRRLWRQWSEGGGLHEPAQGFD